MRKATIVGIAITLIIGGIGLSIVGLMLGASTSVQITKNGIELGRNAGWGIGTFNTHNDGGINTKNTYNEEIIEENLLPFSRLDIDVATLKVNVIKGDHYGIKVKKDRDITMEYGINNDVLEVKQDYIDNQIQFGIGFSEGRFDGEVTVVIPEDAELEKLQMNMGVGRGYIENLQVKDAQISGGVGTLDIENLIGESIEINTSVGDTQIDGLTTDKLVIQGDVGRINGKNIVSNGLEASYGVGDVQLEGIFNGDMDVTCGVGRFRIDLSAEQQDYNYKIEKNIGSLKINGNRYNGLDDVEVDNNAQYTLFIEGAVGDIEINTK